MELEEIYKITDLREFWSEFQDYLDGRRELSYSQKSEGERRLDRIKDLLDHESCPWDHFRCKHKPRCQSWLFHWLTTTPEWKHKDLVADLKQIARNQASELIDATVCAIFPNWRVPPAVEARLRAIQIFSGQFDDDDVPENPNYNQDEAEDRVRDIVDHFEDNWEAAMEVGDALGEAIATYVHKNPAHFKPSGSFFRKLFT